MTSALTTGSIATAGATWALAPGPQSTEFAFLSNLPEVIFFVMSECFTGNVV
jgi:hypothetical protein